MLTVLKRKKASDMEMTERKKKILAAVVERYILSGEPVGSKALVDLPGFPFRPLPFVTICRPCHGRLS